MKTYLLTVLCMVGACLPAYSQNIVTVNTTQSGAVTKVVAARDEVRLLPGFSVKPTGSYSFTAKIDETVLCEPAYVAEVTSPSDASHPHNRQLNTSLAVGSIAGAADVSPMGGAMYNIPVSLPEGVGGMTPQLAVTYNSQGRSGTMGIGWGLTGLSAISRTGRTIYHDGVAAAMDFAFDSGNDRLMLDGQRLIAVEGGPGLTATKYRTENETFAVVESLGTTLNRYFVVTTRDGKTIEYGKTDDSRMDTSNGLSGMAAWCINKITDKYGNFISYTYHKESYGKGIHYIQKIEYGNKDRTVGKVLFGYDKRVDNRRVSVGSVNQVISQTVLLKQITTYSGDTRINKYVFNYACTEGNSKLVEVKLENGNGESLNPTLFTWTKPSVNLDAVQTSPCSFDIKKEKIPLDYNGDGITDLLEISTTECQWTLYKGPRLCGSGYQTRLDLLYNEDWYGGYHGVESQILEVCPNANSNDSRFKNAVNMLGRIQAWSIGDFDGNGLPELAVITRRYDLTNNSYTPASSLCDYLSGSTTSFYPDYPYVHALTVYDISSGYANPIFRKELDHSLERMMKQAIDFNHNGKSNLIVDDIVYDFNRYPQATLTEIGTTSGYYYSDVQWADFNGDGKLDFVYNDRDIYIQNANDYNFTKTGSSVGGLLGIIDINGDGQPRLLMRGNLLENIYDYIEDKTGEYVWDGRTSRYWFCPDDPYYYNNSSYNPCYPDLPSIYDRYRRELRHSGYKLYLYHPLKNMYSELNFYQKTQAPVIISDVDADGTPDVLVCRVEGANVYVDHILYQFRATGDNTTDYTYLRKDRNFYIGSPLQGDFDGDGIMELMSTSGSLYKFATGTPGQLLASATNGYNQKTLFEYAPLTSSSVYSKGYSEWPVASLAGPLYVVKAIKQDNGLAAQTVVNYTYTDGKVHLPGKGFLGYASMKANNTTTGAVVQTNNTFDLTRGVLSRTVTTTTRGGKTAETTNTFTIADVDAATRRIRMYLGERREKDIDGNTVTATCTVDANGNTTKEVTDYGGGLSTTVNYSGHTAMGYPQTVETVQKHPNDNASFTNRTTYLYNDRGRATQKTENYGTDKALTTVYAYNDNGNLETSTLNYSYNGAAKTTVETYVYDPTGRFITGHHVKAGGVTEKTLATPDIMGRPTAKTGTNGQTTTYEYDSWGRLVTTRHPGDLTETGAIRWAATRDGYYTVSQATGQAEVRTEYDLAGREKASYTKGIGNTDITTTHTCNTLGQLVKTVSVTGDLSQTTVYEYHTDGRLKKETTGSNVTEYIYNAGRETEVRYNGKSTKKKLDGWGNVTETTDQLGNKVAYTYYSSGRPKNITAAGANYGMEYDAAGNQTKLADPNAGTIRYTYDALGRPETQTDARGYRQKTEYDDWGRVARVTLRDTTTRYTYFTEGSGKGQLQKVAELAGATERHSIAWEYDDLGRPQKETRKVAGVTGDLVTSYSYDSNGNIATVTYPGGVTETRGYDSYSNLTSVKAGGATVWSFTSATGKTTRCQLGNMSTETVYDNNGLLAALKSNSGNLRNFSYTFDPATGNLSQRTGMNGTESFTYDDLSRLKTAGAMNITYLANGNIDTKTGVGKYGYGENSAGPHAVTSVANTSGLVPGQMQQISYTAFNKVKTITETKGGKNYRLEIDYGPDHERVKTELKENGNVIKTVIFAGNYERITKGGVTKELYYIGGGEGLCAILVRQNNANTLYYVHPDHLGSLAIITDANGGIQQKCTYDAWGKRTLVQGSLIFDRGFTGHEHLEEFALVNMNGRMYDPTLGRFLSPDPYVQNPLFSQSFNRYAYCHNNPLIFTDPDGEFPWLAVAIGAIIGGITGHKIGKAHGATGWGMAGYIFGGAVIGGFAGYAGAAVYTAGMTAGALAGYGSFMAGVNAGMLSGMVAGAINGFGMTALTGGNMSDMLGNMVQGAVVGGFAAAAGAAAFQGVNKVFETSFTFANDRITLEKPFKILPINTLSYMAGSTASQMTVNLVNGRNPFKGVDYGINVGILFPLTVDALTYSQKFNMNIAKKQYTKSSDITGIGNSQTTIMPNGDLRLDQNLYIQEYYPEDLVMDMYNYVNKLDLGTPHILAGKQSGIVNYWVHSTFIPNYQLSIFSIFNSLSIKRR